MPESMMEMKNISSMFDKLKKNYPEVEEDLENAEMKLSAIMEEDEAPLMEEEGDLDIDVDMEGEDMDVEENIDMPMPMDEEEEEYL